MGKVILKLFLFAFFFPQGVISDSFGQWVPTNGPLYGDIHSFVIFGDTLFATAGYQSNVYKSSDHGVSWNQISSLDTLKLSELMIRDQIIFGSGDNGIFRSMNGGVNWIKCSSPGNAIQPLIAQNTKYIFAGGNGGIIYRSSDNGDSWTPLDSIPNYVSATSLFANDSVLLVGTQGNGIDISTDLGHTWLIAKGAIQSALLIGVIKSIGGTIFAGSYGQTGIFRSTDFGYNWILCDSLATLDFISFGNALFAATFRSIDTGKSWIDIGVIHRCGALAISGQNFVAGSINTGIWYRPLSDFLNAVNTILTTVSKFTLLSNPTTSSADFQFDALKEPAVFELFDALGRSLLRRELPAGQASLHVDMQSYPAGIYFARLGGESVKFVKN